MNETYDTVIIPLTNAGSTVIGQEMTFLHVASIEDESSGVQDLDGIVQVSFNADHPKYVDLRINNTFRGFTKRAKVQWAAQSGKIAKLFVSKGDLAVETPATKQLVTSSIGTDLEADTVTVGTSAQLIAAANGTRQKLTVYNNGSATIYLGGSGVTTGDGFPIAVGGAFTFTGTTAAVYGISGGAGNDVRVIEED